MPEVRLTVPMLVIATVVAVSVLALMSSWLKRALILNPYLVRQGQLHRLLTAGWVHADTTHLLFNMFTLYFFADQLVKALDPVRFLVLYVSAVIVAHLPTTLRHMNDPRYNSLGASGAVAAVMFATILLYPGMKLSLLFLPIGIPAIAYAIGYLAYSAWSSYRNRDGINHDAHFAGAVYGALLAFVFEPQRVTHTVQHLF